MNSGTRPALPLTGKTVVLGVSGSISAYKSADLCSQLVQEGARVLPILTRGALHFVGAATFAGLTAEPVSIDTFDDVFPREIAHLHYAEVADLFLLAPASANLLARLATGFCDDMLTSALLANRTKPVLVAPAMNTDMWQNPATLANRRTLEERGFRFLEPAVGRLAEGITGPGRLPEPEEIFEAARTVLLQPRDLAGVRVLVTAGPTREMIDPVRYISNRSSGKMGFAVAEAAAVRGAIVTLIAGPTAVPPPPGMAEIVRVSTAAEMRDACLERAASADVVVAAAAVADYLPAETSVQKIKKKSDSLVLKLAPTADILAELGQRKRPGQVLVGFAAETEALEANAAAKLAAKNLNLVVANDVSQEGAGFDVDTNIVHILTADGRSESLPQMSKRAVADAIWDRIASELRGSAP